MKNRLVMGLFTCVLGSLLVMGCSRKNADREWSASDHDRAEESPQANQPNQPNQAPPGMPPSQAPAGGAVEAESEWTSSCAPCHGANGKGDGPVGRQMRAPDLSDPAAQKRMSDNQIASVITKGKGKMPGFKFTPQTIDGLVKKVRSLR